mgnify:CR=1 FL=1
MQGLSTLQFTPDNKRAYAYNVLSVDNATATFIEFNTLSYYLVGTIQMGRNMKASAETDFQVLFNDVKVYSAKYDNGAGQTLVMPTVTPLPIIIPPFTNVKLVCEVNDAADTIAVNFTANVHGTIEQFDLEVKE